MSEKIVTLSDATFDEHVKGSDVPVLVDFWAEWCGPCKMIAPILEEIAEEQAGKIQIAKLNIDDSLEVTQRFDVMSIPTLILFKDGEPEVRLIGSKPKGQLLQALSAVPVGLPVSVGDTGASVSDIQRRLTAILRSNGRPSTREGVFGPGTRAAVEAFQHMRGLRVDGVCGSQTWNALVEAGFHLGDRFLYRRTPMLRGDDVAELQRRLSTLGFDTGRVDGIFGDGTSHALAEFQRNVGLPVDGIAGGATLRELIRLESRYKEPELISAVRARTELRHAPPPSAGRHVAIGESGGLGSVAGALRRRLVSGAPRSRSSTTPTTRPRPTRPTNSRSTSSSACGSARRSPNATPPTGPGGTTQSQGGRLLAELVQRCVPGILGIADAGRPGHVAGHPARDDGCRQYSSSWGRPVWWSSAPPCWPHRSPRARTVGRRIVGLRVIVP